MSRNGPSFGELAGVVKRARRTTAARGLGPAAVPAGRGQAPGQLATPSADPWRMLLFVVLAGPLAESELRRRLGFEVDEEAFTWFLRTGVLLVDDGRIFASPAAETLLRRRAKKLGGSSMLLDRLLVRRFLAARVALERHITDGTWPGVVRKPQPRVPALPRVQKARGPGAAEQREAEVIRLWAVDELSAARIARHFRVTLKTIETQLVRLRHRGLIKPRGRGARRRG